MDTIQFSALVSPGQAVQEKTLAGAGRLTGMRIRFYLGPQLSLRLNPVLARGGKQEIPLPPLEGLQYIAGDDEWLDFPLDIAFRAGDVLRVRANNTTSLYQYNYAALFTVIWGDDHGHRTV